MSRNGSGVYSLPGTYLAVSGETIEAQQHNDPLEDLRSDANAARPIVAGGTGSTTAADALVALGAASTDDLTAWVGPFVSMINGTLAESHSGNAATFALKTAAGTDPTTSDAVTIIFRDATSSSGLFVSRKITSALSVTVSSGATLNFSDATPGRVWIVAFDDAGTVRLGVINCYAPGGFVPYPLRSKAIASSTAMSSSADSTWTFYTGTAVTSVAYTVLGYAGYESGLTTAGTWDASPTEMALFGAGSRLPGDVIQPSVSVSGASSTGTTTLPFDDTIPQKTEGNQYLSTSITPTSKINVIEIGWQAQLANSATGVMTSALIVAGATDAVSAIATGYRTGGDPVVHTGRYRQQAGSTSSITVAVRAGLNNAGTTTLNGTAGARELGSVSDSYIAVKEIMV